MTTVILYMPQREGSGEDLFSVIRKAIPDCEFEIYCSLGRLSLRLHQQVPDVSVVILCVSGLAEMNRMMKLAEILSEHRIVMILPNSRPDMITKAFVFHPQFIITADNDLRHLDNALARMSDLYSNVYLAH